MNFEEKLNKGFELLREKDIDYALDVARELQKNIRNRMRLFTSRLWSCNS